MRQGGRRWVPPQRFRVCALSPPISPNTITQIERLTPDMGFFIKKPLFPLGKLLIAEAVHALDYDINRLLKRHQSGDFGCVDQYDIVQNLQAIECGDAILSQYHVMVGEKKILICVMTEGDRSCTVLFIVDQKKLKSPEAPENGNNQSPE
jgi:hypothetical protein